ncbi:MAG: hypothetical protein IPG81_06750 [Sandaracinaceae bacterium]|nr:hypothetical protein [Sandaracinaceae bacterium]
MLVSHEHAPFPLFDEDDLGGVLVGVEGHARRRAGVQTRERRVAGPLPLLVQEDVHTQLTTRVHQRLSAQVRQPRGRRGLTASRVHGSQLHVQRGVGPEAARHAAAHDHIDLGVPPAGVSERGPVQAEAHGAARQQRAPAVQLRGAVPNVDEHVLTRWWAG